MLRAAVGGILDFSRANPRDPQWIIKRDLALVEMLVRDHIDLCRMDCLRLIFEASLFGQNRPLQADSLKRSYDARLDLLQLLLHGRTKSQRERESEQSREALSDWERQFGSLQSAETQQNLDVLVEWLKNRRTEA